MYAGPASEARRQVRSRRIGEQHPPETVAQVKRLPDSRPCRTEVHPSGEAVAGRAASGTEASPSGAAVPGRAALATEVHLRVRRFPDAQPRAQKPFRRVTRFPNDVWVA